MTLKGYLNPSSAECNKTVQSYVYNLTSSYTDQRNEAPMVATSVIMFILAALFFNLNLFSRLSDISTILNPSVRLFLSTSLSLFLPVMSYLFSEAKNQGANAAAGHMTDQARTILMWMLLVELLRRKVEAILLTAGGGGGGVQGYSGTIERAARIAWLGYLVFYNLRSAGKRALFGILWVFAASKLVQRFVTLELGKRSFAYGKNPQLVSSYMTKVIPHVNGDEQEQHQHGDNDNGQRQQLHGKELLEECNYVVMGEEELEKTAGPTGPRLKSTEVEAIINKDDGSPVVTVGKIWKLPATDDDRLLQRLKRMCLSFALFKLLRRRLEDIPISSEEARDCHNLIFNGLCHQEEQVRPVVLTAADATDPIVQVAVTNANANTNTKTKTITAAAATNLLQVFNDEVQFLCEYYHSVQPVVFASPFFFLANYVLFPILVWASCVLTILLCSNGDVSYAFQSFRDDNYAVSDSIIKLPGCIVTKITTSAAALFTVVDICVTGLLLLAVAYDEVWELIVFLLSNWFMVSLVSTYTSNPRRRRRRWLMSGVIRGIMSVRNMLSQPNVCFKQFSMLWFCCNISTELPTKAVPAQTKKAIVERLYDAAALTKGMGALESDEHRDHRQLFSPVCEGDGGVAEVILTLHITTELLEAEHPLPRKEKPGASREVATALSRYCAYLVAFRPELLPDDKDGTEHVYKETKEELKKKMGWFWYYCSGVDARSKKLKGILEQQHAGKEEAAAATTLAKLGKALTTMADDVWKLLANVWYYCSGMNARSRKLKDPEQQQGKEEAAAAAGMTTLHKGAKLGKDLMALVDEHKHGHQQTGEVAVTTMAVDVWKLLANVWTEVVTYAAPTSSELHVKAHKEALAQGGELITVLWALTTHIGIARAGTEGTGSQGAVAKG